MRQWISCRGDMTVTTIQERKIECLGPRISQDIVQARKRQQADDFPPDQVLSKEPKLSAVCSLDIPKNRIKRDDMTKPSPRSSSNHECDLQSWVCLPSTLRGARLADRRADNSLHDEIPIQEAEIRVVGPHTFELSSRILRAAS